MPVSATRRLMTGGWGSPKLDIKDPVFYAPLWRPDMVARGGSIVNGTGTMDVSPQALAVGANTITVTVAGTLIVSIPEGGTVASGTMTVTGSPVTVSAGITTTITTTGAIGNITVTPSNIIRSKDKNNYALTDAGATWSSQGRTFDGVDDNINCGDITALNSASAFSIVIWAKQDVLDLVDHLFMKGTGSGGTDHLIGISTSTDGNMYIYFRAGSNTYATLDYSTAVTAGVFFRLALIFDGSLSGNANRLKLLINNVQQTLTFTGTIPATSGAIAGTSLLLGTALSLVTSWDGVMGEALIYNRALTAQEDQRIGLDTKWRYV